MTPKKQTMNFEEAFQKLEAIVDRLEGGEIALDEAVKAFEEGMGLVEICTKKLNDAEARLKTLTQGEDGGFQVSQEE